MLGLAAHWRLVPAVHALPAAAYLFWHARRPRPAASAAAFLASAVAAGGLLTIVSAAACGNEYVNAAILHHASRSDARHNFAPFFLGAHLGGGRGRGGRSWADVSWRDRMGASGLRPFILSSHERPRGPGFG